MVSEIIGIIFLLAGILLLRFPPKKINYLYGYRTQRSMANQAAWDKAQRFSSIEMIRIGIIQVIFGIIVIWLDVQVLTETLMSIVLMLLLVLFLFLRTEKAIKR